MIILLVIAVVAVGAALGSVVLVSLASRREDAAHSLRRGPSGGMEAAARRLVGFHGDAIARRPVRKGASRDYRRDSRLFGHDEFLGDDEFLADATDVPHLLAG
jgi:hypothetical protein